MNTFGRIATMLATFWAAALSFAAQVDRATPADGEEPFLSPTALVASADGQRLYIACATADRVLVLDTAQAKVVQTIPVPLRPLGLALSPNGDRLFITCAAPESTVCVVDTATGQLTTSITTGGHTTMAPVVSQGGSILFVCDRFNDEVAFVELATGKVLRRVRVPREPISAAITRDGRFLLVANHLQPGRADVEVVAAPVSVIDLVEGQVVREIALPNGSTLVRDIRVSPDGRHAVVAHQLSRFHLPTTQLERGWVNTSAISVIDVARWERINTVLLDNIDAGAANPWAVAWNPEGSRLCVTHAGTHELSVIDFPALLAKLEKLASPDSARKVEASAASRTAADVPNDLSFLVGLRQRIRLAANDRGPRAAWVAGSRVWVANYFSDTLSVVDLAAGRWVAESVALGPVRAMTQVRRGEFLFNDGSICFQGWQSCSSCHSDDARVDGLNWDNLNDGIGNPKSSKSLLLGHQTPPAMWTGVRSNAYLSVRTGIRNSLFTVQPPDVPLAIDAFMESLKPIPSPALVQGRLSPAAERGKLLFFNDDAVGCAPCHRGELYTDLKLHDVGTVGKYDQATNRFDTPTLIEVWRTAPYLHDGRAATLREVLTTFNSGDQHGTTSHLTPAQIEDLVAFIRSL